EQLLAVAIGLSEGDADVAPADHGALSPAQTAGLVVVDGHLTLAVGAGADGELGAPAAASPAAPPVFAQHAPRVAVAAGGGVLRCPGVAALAQSGGEVVPARSAARARGRGERSAG